MSLHLQVVSRHRQSLGERGEVEFGPNGGTIGRSLESDWVLPDGQRVLSSRHASVDYRSGSYYIIDTSTNEVFINGAERPVGRGNPQRIFSGDRIRIGEYEILVSIDEGDGVREPINDDHHVDPVDLKQFVEAPEPTHGDLLDALEITGIGLQMVLDEDEADTLSPLEYKFECDELTLADDTPPARAETPPARTATSPPRAKAPSARPAAPPARAKAPPARETAQPEPASEPRAQQSVQRPPPQRRTEDSDSPARRHAAVAREGSRAKVRQEAPSGSPSAEADALEAFFRGAGLDPRKLDPKQAEQTMFRLGQLVREVVVGVSENLHLRAAQRATLGQSDAAIAQRNDNVLAGNVDEVLGKLLLGGSGEHSGAVESAREAFGDIKSHQQALLNSVQAAVARYVGRLDPDQLERKFANGKRGMLLGAANKYKYWDMYRDLYLVVGQAASGEMPQMFVEELAKAYESEVERAEEAQSARRHEPAIVVKVG